MTTVFRKRGIVHFHPRKAELLAEVERVWALAQSSFQGFNVDLNAVPVVLHDSGRAAGCCKTRRTFEGLVFNLEFNTKVMDLSWDEMLDTIPHEIAHLVDVAINGNSSNHGPRWQRIANKLGCSAKRCHDVQVEKSRKVRKWKYVATCGTVIELTTNRHNKVQRGAVFVLRNTNGKIAADGFKGQAA